jgi:hypothetical protein
LRFTEQHSRVIFKIFHFNIFGAFHHNLTSGNARTRCGEARQVIGHEFAAFIVANRMPETGKFAYQFEVK